VEHARLLEARGSLVQGASPRRRVQQLTRAAQHIWLVSRTREGLCGGEPRERRIELVDDGVARELRMRPAAERIVHE
jgi:hypothetical protein